MNTTKDVLYNSLVDTIKDKIPERGKLTTTLVDMLGIEKEAVYRRLRGEVPFTFAEIAIISNEMDISIDNIIRTTSSKSCPFQMKLIDFRNPTEADFFIIENYATILEDAKNDPHSETGVASNVIPINICIAYKNIYKFHLLKWMYQIGDPDYIQFSQVIPSERLDRINKKSIIDLKQFGRTYYIWDKNTIPALVNDIHYFENIKLINREEIDLIKDELFLMLNDLENIAILGEYDTGKKVDIYVSSLNFETSYSYVETRNHHLSVIRSFTLNDTTSLDMMVFNKIKKWMQSLVRTATLISGSNEVERILFFERQREIVGRL